MLTSEQVQERLGHVEQMLEADGYRMVVAVEPEAIAVRIEATSDACADCLIPRELMTDIIADALRRPDEGGDVSAIRLRYPTDPE